MDVIGKSPISVPAIVIGKVALFACSLFFIAKFLNIDAMLYDSTSTSISGMVLYVVGIFLVILSLIQLGQSAAVGIPERDTKLITHGLYRFTRNPIYLGAFIMCAGSCLFSIHIINFLLFAIAVGVHHQIVIKEEEFLEKRFGRRWLDYEQQVPRYVGVRRSHPRRSGA